MRKGLILLILALAGASLIGEFAADPAGTADLHRNAGMTVVLVLHVIDGDTIAVSGGEKVRYLGMDAPETVDPRKPRQCFGKEAAEANKRLVEGKFVRLEMDATDRDKYGRLLRYAYLLSKSSDEAGIFVNLKLVQEGYARALPFGPDLIHADEFSAAEKSARESGIGLWKACG